MSIVAGFKKSNFDFSIPFITIDFSLKNVLLTLGIVATLSLLTW